MCTWYLYLYLRLGYLYSYLYLRVLVLVTSLQCALKASWAALICRTLPVLPTPVKIMILAVTGTHCIHLLSTDRPCPSVPYNTPTNCHATLGTYDVCASITCPQLPHDTPCCRRKRQTAVLGYPTYMSADLCFTMDSSFFFSQLLSALAERNSTKTGQMLGSECDLKMHVRNLGYPLPYKPGDKKITFYDDFAN